MTQENKSEPASVFFCDIVGLSADKFTDMQVKKIKHLNSFVNIYRENTKFPKIDLLIMTGDGMAVTFGTDYAGPMIFAKGLHEHLETYNRDNHKDPILVRVGLNYGPVIPFDDSKGQRNVWGPGIIMAQRIMSLGSGNHILMTGTMADALKNNSEFGDSIRMLDKPYTIKHDLKIPVYLYFDGKYGNNNDPVSPVPIVEISYELEKINSITSKTNSSVLELTNKIDELVYVGYVHPTILTDVYRDVRYEATDISATWFGQYPNITNYFREERIFLNDKQAIKPSIQRVINFLAISLDDQMAHEEHYVELQNNPEYGQFYECVTSEKWQDIEYMIAKKENAVKAVFTILSDFKPGFGIKLDPAKKPELRDATQTLNTWFKTLWDKNKQKKFKPVAKLWDDIATNFTGNLSKVKQGTIFGSYIDAEETELLKIFDSLSENSQYGSIIEIGSGTGRALKNLHQKMKSKPKSFLGLDFSENMVNKAREELRVAGISDKEVRFEQCDPTDSNSVSKFFSQDKQVKNIVCCLLNTLGNIYPKKIDMLIENMKKLANGGPIIISILNGDDFKILAYDIYPSLRSIVGKIDKKLSYCVKERIFRTSNGYFSQWYTQSYLAALASKHGLKVVSKPMETQFKKKKITIAYIFTLTPK